MLKAISSFISYIFHPIFYLLYTFVLLLIVSDYFLPFLHTYRIGLVIGYVFFTSVLIPLALIYFMQKDFQMEDRNKRMIPLFTVGLVYVLIYFFFQRFLMPVIIMKYVLGLSIGLFLLAILNRFKKISIHACGAGSFTALIFYLFMREPQGFYPILMIAFFISGMVISSRLYLGKHTNFEMYSGYAVGIVVMLASLVIF